MLYVFIIGVQRDSFQMVFVSFNSHMTGVNSRAETHSHSGTSESIPILVGDRVAQHLVVVFGRSLFVPLYILFWPL